MTVGEAQSRLTHHEVTRWVAYFEKNGYPSGAAVNDEMRRGFALLATVLVNVNGGYKDGSKAKVQDFLPGPKGEVEDASPADVARLLQAAWGGKGKSTRRVWKRRSRR